MFIEWWVLWILGGILISLCSRECGHDKAEREKKAKEKQWAEAVRAEAKRKAEIAYYKSFPDPD